MDTNKQVSLCVAVAGMGLFFYFYFLFLIFFMFRSCSALQEGEKEKMFVTALRPICLTVGVIAGKMGRVSEVIYSDVCVGVGPSSVGTVGCFSRSLSLFDDHQISQLADFVFSGWHV